MGAELLGAETPEAMADVSFDAVGLSETLGEACAWTQYGASVCLAGMAAPQISLNAYQISTVERNIVGSFCYAPQDFRKAVGLLQSHTGLVENLVSEVIEICNLPQRMSEPADGDVPSGKVLVVADVSANPIDRLRS